MGYGGITTVLGVHVEEMYRRHLRQLLREHQLHVLE